MGTLTTPAPGTYTYASSGSYQLSGDEETTLPESATATVTSDDTGWTIEVTAGDAYTDRFGFTLAAAGLQWQQWSLDRVLQGERGTTDYSCTGDEPVYVADAPVGRTTNHGCTTQGVTSAGTITLEAQESVTLGDGTTILADRLVYAYTVSGPSVVGEGRLDLWLDRRTGLRVREVRHIESTTRLASGELEYREDVEFLLQSLTPTGATP